MFNTPILFLIFNRPDTTKIVFERIREIKPKFLFIAADGPRTNRDGEEIICKETRELVVNNIDWNCEVKTLFRENNLGCGLAVSEAISWFFKNVEQGIIIEDDILPTISFFHFAEKMLVYFKDDTRIMMISGFNVAEKWNSDLISHFYAFYGSIWGWASWRRAWKKYDFNLKFIENQMVKNQLLNTYFSTKEERAFRQDLYNKLYLKEIDTWDYQWTVSKLLNHGLNVIPAKNMINNIGFNYNATHTFNKPLWLPQNTYEIFDIEENKYIFRDKDYDDFHVLKTLGYPIANKQQNLIKRIIKYLLNKLQF
jgi:hypothetical protein